MITATLITGASSGIGYQFARIFAQNGHNLVLVARREDRLISLAKELEDRFQVTIRVISMDLSKPGSAAEVFKKLNTDNIHVNILINNAGIGAYGYFYETDWEKDLEMINLNVVTLTYFCKLFAQQDFRKENRKILNVASTAAFQPGPLMAVYYATKAYVHSFSEAIANEFADQGIQVTVLSPGPTKSEFQEKANMLDSKLVNSKLIPFASSEKVALYGYNALMQGKTVAIEGVFNKIGVFLVRLSPRGLVRKIVRFISEKADN